MSGPDVLQLRARPTRRSQRQVLGVPVVMTAVGLGVTVAGLFGQPAALVVGLLQTALGAVAVARGARALWPGVLLQLDDEGVHVRRGASFVSVPWPRVARLYLVRAAAEYVDGNRRDVVILGWVPVDDADVPPGTAGTAAGEQHLSMTDARSRLVTFLNGRDRSPELREIRDWVAARQPHVRQLDAALDVMPEVHPPDPELGPPVLVVADDAGALALLPHVVAALRLVGRRAVVPMGSGQSLRFAAAAGAGVHPGPDLDGIGAVVVLRLAPLVTDEPVEATEQFRDGLEGRPAVLLVTDRARAERAHDIYADHGTVVLAPTVSERPPTGIARLVPAVAGPGQALPTTISAADLAALVPALLDRPVGGLLHATGGSATVADAVAGSAG